MLVHLTNMANISKDHNCVKILGTDLDAGDSILNTGQPRYFKVQGNGENTSSYPKFDISKMWRHPNMVHVFKFLQDILLQYMCSQTVPSENRI